MALKHRLFSAGFKVIASTRADRWLRPLAQGVGVILTLHHVRPWQARAFAPNRLLEITPQFLDRALSLLLDEGFDIVPLDEVPARLQRGQGGRPFAALTFDDGYRDNLEHALPVLKRHRAPWTLFVATDFAEGRGRLWWLELEEAIARLERLRLPLDGEILEVPTSTVVQKQAAFAGLYARLRAGPEARLRAATAALAKDASVDPGALCRSLCLTWDELSALTREPGVALGAHTLSHPMLAKQDEATAGREIGESKQVIEDRLGVEVRHFSYPVGDPSSAGEREFRLARAAGYATAVTTRPGHLFRDHRHGMHALPRVSLNGLFQSDTALRALLSGVPFLAWSRRPAAA